MTRDQWIRALERLAENVAADPAAIGVLSTGEQCAVALVLDKEELLQPDGEGGRITMRPHGYSWLDCVARLEPELLAAAIAVQRRRS